MTGPPGFGLAITRRDPGRRVDRVLAKLMELTVYPLLLGLNAVPKIAIAPILILWMGFGPGPKILVASCSASSRS